MKLTPRTLVALSGLTGLLAVATAQADILEANMVSLRVQLRGQLLAEATDYGSGNDRLDDRTDLRFARFRLTITGMFYDK